jgi:hypothetical protein
MYKNDKEVTKMDRTENVVLPERVIDVLFQAAGVSTYHPDGDQLNKLHAFAHGVTEEVLARLPARAEPIAWYRKTDITELTDSEPETDGWKPLYE